MFIVLDPLAKLLLYYIFLSHYDIPKLLKQDGINFIVGNYFLQFMIEGR